MQNPENRELMAELYRIMERHEVTPTDKDQYTAYFTALMTDVQVFYRKWWQEKHNPFGHHLAHALYAAFSDMCKEN